VPPQEAAGRGAPAAQSETPDYRLITPPNYENIVGGLPPSPFASFFLVVGLILLLMAAVGGGAGFEVTQLWVLGAMFGVIALFLAAFVSRSG
jgi:hypothetical protein